MKGGHLVRGGLVGIGSRGAAIAAGYVHVLLVARLLDADAVGELAVGFAVVNIGSTLSRLGVDNALIRLGSVAHDQGGWSALQHLVRLTVATAICGAAIAGSLVLMVSRIDAFPIAGSGSVDAIRIAAFGIAPMSMISVSASMMRCLGALSIHAITQFGIVPVAAAAWFVLARLVFDRDVDATLAYVESLYGSFLLCAVLGAIVIARSTTAERARPTRAALIELGPFLRIALPMLLASAGFVLLQWIDTLMLDGAVDQADVGGYAVAMRLGMAIEVPLVVLGTVVNAEFARRYQHRDLAGIERLARSTALAATAIAVPLTLPMVLAPDRILGLFDPAFEGARTALVLLAFVRLASVMCGAVIGVLIMTDNQNVIQWALGSAVVCNIALNALLIPVYGITGAAIGQVAAILLWNTVAIVIVRQRLAIWAGISWTPIAELLHRRRGLAQS